MPFLKERKMSVTRTRIEACERNGWRKAIRTSGPCAKIYKGEWKSDKKNGRGSQLDLGRSLLYEGEWSQGRKSGYGELFRLLPYEERRKIYAGHWSNGKKHGHGRYWLENGAAYYEGDFRSNRKHGFGCYWHADRTFYRGTWKNDLYHGEGFLVLANGNRYEGSFYEGKRHGRGTFCHASTGQLQEGHWYENRCVGGTMEDTEQRQSARSPTFYPIPKLGFSAINGNELTSTDGPSGRDDEADRVSLFRHKRQTSSCTVDSTIVVPC